MEILLEFLQLPIIKMPFIVGCLLLCSTIIRHVWRAFFGATSICCYNPPGADNCCELSCISNESYFEISLAIGCLWCDWKNYMGNGLGSALNKPDNFNTNWYSFDCFSFCGLGKHDFFYNERKYLLTPFKLIELKFQLATIESIRFDTLTRFK